MAGSDELRVIVTAAVKDAMRDLKKVDKAVDDSAKRMAAAGASLNKIGSSLTRYLTAPIMGAAVASVKFAADLEKQQVAFATLLGDVKKGAELFERLKKFSASTPLQLEDITQGAQTLLAFGSSAADVESELRMLGDAAMGEADKLGALTSAYGKLQAKGVATLEEINRFTENGVPLLDALGRELGVSTQEVLKFVSTGKVKFADVQKALRSLTSEGGQFAGMMDKMSQTTAGKFSTAMDNLKLSAAKLGEALLPIANQIIDRISAAAEKFGAMDEGAQKAVITLGAIAALAGPLMKTAGSVAQLAAKMAMVNWAQVGGVLAKLGPAGLAVGVVAGATIGIGAAIDKSYTRKINEDAAFRQKAIAEDLYLAERSLSVYLRIADSYGESLDTVVKISREQGYITKELEEQYALWKRASEMEPGAMLEAAGGGTGPGAGAAPTPSAGGGEARRAWQLYFEDITGSFGETGEKAAGKFIAALNDELTREQVVGALTGGLDMSAAIAQQQEKVKAALTRLFEIDPTTIDLPFQVIDDAVKALSAYYQELEERKQGYAATLEEEAAAEAPLIAQKTRLAELLDQESTKIEEANELWSVYWQVQEELKNLGYTEEERLALESLNQALRDQLGITEALKQAQEGLTEAEKERKEIAGQIQEIYASIGQDLKSVAEGVALDLLESMTEAFMKAESASDAMRKLGDTVVETAASIMKQVAPLLLQAGLKLIAAGAYPVGIALVAASGLVAIAGAAIGASVTSYQSQNDYESLIMDQEQELADQRMELLKETLERERELREENLRKLDATFNQEFEVLRDAWERNLIGTEEFIRKAGDLNVDYEAQRETAEQPYEEAQAAVAAEEQAQKDLEKARTAKLAALASAALVLEQELQGMSSWQKFWSTRDEQIAAELAVLDRRIEVARNAGTIAEVQAAREGADFVTSGPRLLMVGDNPGGRERVSVTPFGSPNRYGPSGEVINFNLGNVYGIDDLAEKLEQARSRLERRRRIPA